jgi:hypothetical protein
VRPVLITNPRSDEAFVAAVEAAVDGADAPADLQARLRERYPQAVVRPRDLSSEPVTVWYVYRDGHWVSDRRS